MKKTFKIFGTMVAMMILSSGVAFADVTDPTVPPVNPGTKTTYYGTEASNNPNNPCKGATVRVCGVIEQTPTSTPGGIVMKKVVKNADGQVLSVTTTPIKTAKSK